ncbi:MAG: hypothetical protein MUF43_09715 [Flavobacterium sp.]|jgi:hypothetical protein|nr:hypothetical protein [Flavobacterium sp.]
MKLLLTVVAIACSFISLGQNQVEAYLKSYNVDKNTVRELTFTSKESFQSFIAVFEDKKGFELPKFLIYDNTGSLIKHRLDVLISACGKGDVQKLKKNYHKNLPTVEQLQVYFNEPLQKPIGSNFIVIFIWHQAMDAYNKHTFETYHTWKENPELMIYFLNLNWE